MEKLKDPAMLLSLVNSIGLIGETVYFYKQLETVNENIEKLNANMTKLTTSFAEIKKGNMANDEQTKSLTRQLNHINNTLDNLSVLTDDVSDIIETLYEHDIEVTLTDRSYRSGDRRDQRRPHSIEDKKSDRKTERKPERKPEKRPERKPERRPERHPERKPADDDQEDDDDELIRELRSTS